MSMKREQSGKAASTRGRQGTKATRAQKGSEGKRPAARSRAVAKARKARALKTHAEGHIDQFLQSVGVKDPKEWTDEDGWREIHYGNVVGAAYAEISDIGVAFTVLAELIPLPSDEELIVPLMREALEANTLLVGEPRLAIGHGRLVVCAVDLVEDMQDADFGLLIQQTMDMADRLAPVLKKQYGGTTRKRAKA